MKEKITVLIADDNSEFANNLAGYVEREEEMEVIGMARDGNEAYDMVCNIQPDVLLLDVIMPHLDGIGVLEKIQSANLRKPPLCIMLSAVGQDKITQRALDLGAEYYVVKPFDIKLLLKRIKDLRNYQPSQFKNVLHRIGPSKSPKSCAAWQAPPAKYSEALYFPSPVSHIGQAPSSTPLPPLRPAASRWKCPPARHTHTPCSAHNPKRAVHGMFRKFCSASLPHTEALPGPR